MRSFAPAAPADLFELHDLGDEKIVIGVKHPDIRGRHTGLFQNFRPDHGETGLGDIRRLFGAVVIDDLAIGGRVDDIADIHFPRPLRACQQHGRGPVGEHHAVEQPDRRRDHAGIQVIPDRDRHPQFFVRKIVQHRAVALRHRQPAEALKVQVVLMHIPVHQQAETAGRPLNARGIPEIGPVPAIGGLPGGRRRIGAQHHGKLAHAGLYRHRRPGHAGDRRAAAMIADIHPARRDAEIIGQVRRVILVRGFRMGNVCRKPVDIRRYEAGFDEDFLQRFGSEFVRRPPRAPLYLRFRTGNDPDIASGEKIRCHRTSP